MSVSDEQLAEWYWSKLFVNRTITSHQFEVVGGQILCGPCGVFTSDASAHLAWALRNGAEPEYRPTNSGPVEPDRRESQAVWTTGGGAA